MKRYNQNPVQFYNIWIVNVLYQYYKTDRIRITMVHLVANNSQTTDKATSVINLDDCLSSELNTAVRLQPVYDILSVWIVCGH